MTDAKKLKSKIRERAARTGESYSTARRHVLAQLQKERDGKTAATAQRARSGHAIGSVSEARCIEKTGAGFDHWFAVLDRFGAKQGHTALAKHLREEQGVSAWYAQSITVAYERAKGLRELGQSCAGDYQTSVSRTLSLGLDDARALLTRKPKRARWLDGLDGPYAQLLEAALRSARFKAGKDVIRLRHRAPLGAIELELRPKDDAKTVLTLRHTKIGDEPSREAAKAAWKVVLDAVRSAS